MKHYQVFGDKALDSPQSWDALRLNHPHFSISPNREEWLSASELLVKKDGQDGGLIERARGVTELLKREGIERVFSLGVGGAALEYQMKKMMPGVKIVCSDYSTVTVETLKKVFLKCDEIVFFDLMKDDWVAANKKYLGHNALCLMYRIDASMSDGEWHSIFKTLHGAGVEKVLYIPTGMLTVLSVYNRKWREIKWFFKGVKKRWSGYVRTKKRFEQYWRGLYGQEELALGGLRSFFLTRKD